MSYTVVTTRFDTTTNKDLLKDGILRKEFDTTAGKVEVFWPRLVNSLTTQDEWVRDVRMAGLGYASKLAEGEGLPIQGPLMGSTKDYTQEQWGTGFRMTHRAQKFLKYGKWEKWVRSLAKVMKQTKDIEIHKLFNDPTNATYTVTGFDGLALAHATHTGLDPNVTTDNYNNYINASFSVSALQDMRYYFRTLIDDRGNWMGSEMTDVVFEPTLYPKVTQVLNSSFVPFEESNTTNKPILDMRLKSYEDPQLTSTTMWFGIAKNEDYDINVFTSQEPDLVIFNAPDTTRDRIATSLQYFTYSFGDPRQYCLGRL